MDLLKTLKYMKPDCKVVVWQEELNNEDFAEGRIIIIDGQTAVFDENEEWRPTLAEIEAVDQYAVETAYNLTNYAELRAKEYPDFREYLDGVVKGDENQIQSYIDKCIAVKLKYPKE